MQNQNNTETQIFFKYIGNCCSSLENRKNQQFIIVVEKDEFDKSKSMASTKRAMKGKVFDPKKNKAAQLDFDAQVENNYVNPFYEMHYWGFPVFVRVQGDELDR